MVLLEISIQTRVVIGISGMIILFCSFLVVFISNQRKRLQYHKELQVIHEEQSKNLQKQNLILEQKVLERTIELNGKAQALEHTLDRLKISQLQLIEKEKMASLGELTAGIAHEIQNPLNFVNNFTDINTDLVKEIQQSFTAANLLEKDATEINLLLKDLTDNQQKIQLHGKRVENIVKSMLQHSRKQSGAMEFTDLNDLVSEYLKLSYQQFRINHKTFKCDLIEHFDLQAGKVEIVKEDIGSILINLFRNAFYSLNEKITEQTSYQPILTISTQKKDNGIKITVRDNGKGIPPGIMHKIFQPFFTTRPPGEGTGLGLSMSYDIIKAHQGELKVNSVENEFAEFVIDLNHKSQ